MREYWLFDLHAHTVCSDGLMTVRQLLHEAKSKGLSGIAITDHDTTACIGKALELARSIDVVVVPGIEVTTREAHLLLYGDVYGVPQRFLKGSSIIDVIEYAVENGLFSSIAHPYGRLLKPYPIVYMDQVLRRIDAVEAINGRTPTKSNRRAMELALRYNKIPTAGSDAHIPEDIGSAVVLFREPIERYEQVIEKLYKGDHIIYGGRPMTQIISSILKKRVRSILSRIRGSPDEARDQVPGHGG